MYVRLYFEADGLMAAQLSGGKPVHDGSGGLVNWNTRAGRFSSSEGEPDVWKYSFDNTDPELIKSWLDRHGITPTRVEIRECAYLDDQAIRPCRGRYVRGVSTATVDSYIDIGTPESFPVWRIDVTGKNFGSAFDLYCRIRRGLEKPTEPWDKIPEEAQAS